MGGLIEKLRWHCETKRTRLVHGRRLKALGKGAVIERGVELHGARFVSIGEGTRLRRGAVLWASEGGGLDIGANCCVDGGARLDSAGGRIEIDDNVYVGPHTYVGGHGGCKIGRDCQIAGGCYIIAANHNFDDRSTPIRLQGYTKQGITIGEDCWFGNGVTVLDGVTISRGCVLAAHAVVTKDVPEYAVAGGVPARVLRFRGETGGKTAGSKSSSDSHHEN
jgi:acetyltransferase-like isoleucine patch superfamily enzyme